MRRGVRARDGGETRRAQHRRLGDRRRRSTRGRHRAQHRHRDGGCDRRRRPTRVHGDRRRGERCATAAVGGGGGPDRRLCVDDRGGRGGRRRVDRQPGREGSRGAGRGLPDHARRLMPMRDATLRRLAWTVFALEVLGFATNAFLVVTNDGRTDFFFGAILFVFPIVGIIVLSRRPRTTLGWLMLSMGAVAALPLEGYAAYAFTHGLPGPTVALAFTNPGWVPFIGLSGFLLLLFPDGHVPSPRGRWFAWMCGV